jgi:membrane protease YdiL (CAAX protease family)
LPGRRQHHTVALVIATPPLSATIEPTALDDHPKIMIPDRLSITAHRIRTALGRDHLFAFFVLTFGISWAAWLPMALSGLSSPWIRILGTFGPTLSALIILAITQGRSALCEIGRRLLIWRVGFGWYLVVFFITAVIILPAIGIHLLLGGRGLEWNDPSQLYLILPAFLQILFLGALGEEIGWRGFALPRLQRPFNALWASLVLGAIWALWHLPLFWMPQDFHSQIPFGLFLLQELGLTILFTWIYNNTRGSLLLASLFHAASNTTIGVLPVIPADAAGSLRPLWLSVGLLSVLAIGIVAVYGPERLSRRPREPGSRPADPS